MGEGIVGYAGAKGDKIEDAEGEGVRVRVTRMAIRVSNCC